MREVLRRKALREGRNAGSFTGRQAGDEIDIAAARAELARLQIRIARVEPGSQAARAGVQVNDTVLSYNGRLITTRTALRTAVEAAQRQDPDAEKILLVLSRRGRKIKLPVKSGSLGVRVAASYSAPGFQ